MGLNLEFVTLLAHLKHNGYLPQSGDVLEFGAQDLGPSLDVIARHISRCLQMPCGSIGGVRDVYKEFGCKGHTSIDASAAGGALAYDMNVNIRATYGFDKLFDIVTNLGTFEHVFNIAEAFRNMHELCAPQGVMLHVLTAAGNVNHGYYNTHPRLFVDMAAANKYEILGVFFSVDYKPTLYAYTQDAYKAFDDRDILIYVAFRKRSLDEFKFPFDSIFSQINSLEGYAHLKIHENYAAYIKSTWDNVRPANLELVPTTPQDVVKPERFQIKQSIDSLGALLS